MEMTKAGTIEYKMPEQTARELLKMLGMPFANK